MDTLLNLSARDLLEDERALLMRLRNVLEATGAEADALRQLGDMIEHLSELFLVVVVGEFNSGKSSVLNALFGQKVMEEGPIPTTAKITLLRHGEAPLTRQLSEFLMERRHPAPLLRHLSLVDTPGTNSIIRQHQKITEDFIPRSDLVLFVTSYDRPLTESERAFLSYIREAWGRRLVVVLNKIDMARDEASLQQVIEHIRSGCRDLMGFEPQIFPVSAEEAFAAKTTEGADDGEARWERSRFAALETFMTETLASEERLALKLAAPVETALRKLEGLEERLGERRAVLEQDEETLHALEAELEGTREELQRDYQRHLAEIDNLLLQMERRGVQFLDDTIRASASKIQLLRDRDRFKRAFEERVVAGTDRELEARVTEIVDGLLNRTTKLQGQMYQTFAERVRAAGATQVPASRRAFSYDRAEVFRATMREADRRMEVHDVRQEASRIIENAHGAANMALGAGAGAAGLGALGAVLVAAPVLDTLGGLGIFTGAALAVAGATILPRQRKKAIREFRERIDALRTDLKTAVARQLDRQIEAALGGVRETIAPYADFVRTEREGLKQATDEQAALQEEAARLQAHVRTQYGSAGVGA